MMSSLHGSPYWRTGLKHSWVARSNGVPTPTPAPSSSGLLPGITRHSVIQVARSLGVEVEQHMLQREALYTADEIFMTGTAAEITPVTQVDKIKIGSGVRGPVTKKLQEKFFGITSGELPDEFGWLTEF